MAARRSAIHVQLRPSASALATQARLFGRRRCGIVGLVRAARPRALVLLVAEQLIAIQTHVAETQVADLTLPVIMTESVLLAVTLTTVRVVSRCNYRLRSAGCRLRVRRWSLRGGRGGESAVGSGGGGRGRGCGAGRGAGYGDGRSSGRGGESRRGGGAALPPRLQQSGLWCGPSHTAGERGLQGGCVLIDRRRQGQAGSG